jgi:hypothetical protein
MNKLIILIAFLTYTISSYSQTNEWPDISADRPGMATPPSMMTARSFQIESGYSYEKDNRENSLQETFLYNTTLLRYGLNKDAEIRLQADYAKVKTDRTTHTGFNPLTIGTKIRFAKGEKIIPETSFLFNLTLPWVGKKEFRPENPAPSFYILCQNDLSEKLNVCYNFGLEYDGSDSKPVDFCALCIDYYMTDKFSAFLENYNWFSKGTKPENFVDCGFAFLISKNLQLDLSGNLNLRDLAKYYMINFGVSWWIRKQTTANK